MPLVRVKVRDPEPASALLTVVHVSSAMTLANLCRVVEAHLNMQGLFFVQMVRPDRTVISMCSRETHAWTTVAALQDDNGRGGKMVCAVSLSKLPIYRPLW